MQWKKITTGLGNTVYSLWNNGQKLLTLAYRSQTDVVYLESASGEKRSFHYKRKGLFKNKMVLENEYGAGLGQIRKEAGREFIEVDGTRYFFNYINRQEVAITPETAEKPVAVCSLEIENPNEQTLRGLLMVSCLYLAGQHPAYRTAAMA